MKIWKLTVLLAWYFLTTAPSAYQVGPFDDKAECERIRKQIRTGWTTSCWSGPVR